MATVNTEYKSPLTSIVIIGHNDEAHIDAAIDSACAQSENGIEIICVNDGSTDTTLEHMLQKASVDARIRVITQPNSGILAARYAGLQHVTSAYTMFLDSDDRLMPEAVKTAYEAAKASDADVLEFGVNLERNTVDPSSDALMIFLKRCFSQDQPLPETDHGPELINACFARQAIPWNVWNKIYRTDLLLEALRNFRGEWVCMCEDMLLTLMILCHAKHYARIHTKLYVHSVGSGLITSADKHTTSAMVKCMGLQWRSLTLAQEWLNRIAYPFEEINEGMTAFISHIWKSTLNNLLEKCAPDRRAEFLGWLSECCPKQDFFIFLSEAIKQSQQGSDEEIEKRNQLLKLNLEKMNILVSGLEEERLQLSEDLEQQQAHIEQLEAENRYLSESFDIISKATCWRITKPIRFVLDVWKWLIQPHSEKHLLHKGLHSLRTNGVSVTWQKAMQKIYFGDSLAQVAKQPLFAEDELAEQRRHHFSRKIKFSIVVPLYNTPERFLRAMIESVQAQTYADWELCMADGSDAEHADVQRICREYADRDKCIRYQKLEKDLGISRNTNACLEMATGDYIGLFDHDDLLHPAALFEVMRTIENTGADLVYTDEAVFVSPDINNISSVHFKPDFAPDNLRANNYLCHFTVFERSLLDEVGQFDPAYDGSQDHDMMLRLTEKAKRIAHIPEILYYWRAHTGSVAESPGEKPYVIKSGIHAIEKQLERLGLEGSVAPVQPGQPIYRIRYAIKEKPMVSILIANHEQFVDIEKCLASIIEKTTWPNYEIVIVEDNSMFCELSSYYERIQRKYATKVHIVPWEGPFNSSTITNYGAQFCTGDYLLLLNNNIKVITPDWIEEMLMFAQREDVGAVGAMLYYPDKTIRNAGICLGMDGTTGSFFQYVKKNSIGYMGRLLYAQNVSAVTSACMLLRRDVWEKVGGLDKAWAIAFNDVDLCLRIRKAGYLIVWTPFAELIHYGSRNIRVEDSTQKKKYFESEIRLFRSRWSKELEAGDPYFNPNFSLDRHDFFVKPNVQQYDAR